MFIYKIKSLKAGVFKDELFSKNFFYIETECDILFDMENNTIVAISTPAGKSGISVVRMSGKESLDIAKQIFLCNAKEIMPRHFYLGDINLDRIKDKGMMVYFKEPNSYTGEDVVEFQCHGGSIIANKIVECCIEKGAKLAGPGEFTKRAFINGKISLDKAEGVAELIDAESESEVRAGYDLVNGNLFKVVTSTQKSLTDLLAEIEVNLDYPEHDIEYKTVEHIKAELEKTKKEIDDLVATERSGRIIKNGISVVIAGKANVGKSSLMNALINFDRAIVTNIAGTTRDVLQESYEYKSIRFNLYDTAGIRESDDIIEQIGVKKAKELLESADLIVLVFDSSTQFDEEDRQMFESVKDKNVIVVLNKCDLPEKFKIDTDYIKISTLKKEGIEQLKEEMYNKVVDENIMGNKTVITNQRHMAVLKEAQVLCENALFNVENMTLDCVALDIKELWTKLGEITGETTDEAIIDKIFSKFCLGK